MKSMNPLLKITAMLLLLALALNGCKKDPNDPNEPPTTNEEEVITTLRLDFTDSAGVQPPVSATFRDPDGTGGAGPDIFDEINLKPTTTYLVLITLLNETVNPAVNISDEVLEENTDHLFCFTVGGGAQLTVQRTDSDGTYEVGLKSKWTTGAAGTGTARIILKHQPDGLKNGSCTPGETDIDVEFTVNIAV